MAISKIILNGETQMDVTGNNVISGALRYGYKATGADGNIVDGGILSKSAQTYTPGTSNQTIPSGVYLSGTQTILGDSNLIGANIANGKSIFGVAGTASVMHSGVSNATSSNVLEFTSLLGEPSYFYVVLFATGTQNNGISNIMGDLSGTYPYVVASTSKVQSSTVAFSSVDIRSLTTTTSTSLSFDVSGNSNAYFLSGKQYVLVYGIK